MKKVRTFILLTALSVLVLISVAYWLSARDSKVVGRSPLHATYKARERLLNTSKLWSNVNTAKAGATGPISAAAPPELGAGKSLHVSKESSCTSTWGKDSFCDDFLSRTFHQRVAICHNSNDKAEAEQIVCKRSPHSYVMSSCVMENVLLRPSQLYELLAWSDRDARMHASSSPSVQLLNVPGGPTCHDPNAGPLDQCMQRFDPSRLIVEKAVSTASTDTNACKRWVNDTTFVFMSSCCHIYFRFLALYNVYKAILDEGPEGSVQVLRVGESHGHYIFPEFEENIFDSTALQDFEEDAVCFKKVVLSPWSYSSVLFDCKQKPELRGRCYACSGKEKCATSFYYFRKAVLDACGLSDNSSVESSYKNPKQVVIILRKSYKRHSDDDPSKVERVLENGEDFVSALKSDFHGAVVSAIHPEDLPICEQIRYAHDADILVGVHGAGLVHSWWQRDSALLFEVIPNYQTGNPTFQMLTTLTGRNYHSYVMRGGDMSRYMMRLNIPDALNSLHSAIKKR